MEISPAHTIAVAKKERDVHNCVCVCVSEGASVPQHHSRAIFHLKRQPRTAASATAAASDLRETMDKDRQH